MPDIQLPGAEAAVLAEATPPGSLKARPQEPLDPNWQLQMLKDLRQSWEMGGVRL